MFKKLLLAAVAALCFTTAAQAQQTMLNSRDITGLCRFGHSANAFGCGLLANSLDMPPVSLIRYLAKSAAKAQDAARNDADGNRAAALLERLQNQLGSQQQIKKKFRIGPVHVGGSNAGLVIETAWITQLKRCTPGNCTLAATAPTLAAMLEVTRKVYPEHEKTWAKIGAVLSGAKP